MSLTCAITGAVTVTDNSTGSVALSQSQNFSYVGSVFEYTNQGTVGTSPTAVTLPVSPVQFLKLQNLSTSTTLAATWTKNGGSSVAVITLDAGGVIQFCETTTSNGITALTLTGGAASTPYSLILAG
jgi:hypothetical protein